MRSGWRGEGQRAEGLAEAWQFGQGKNLEQKRGELGHLVTPSTPIFLTLSLYSGHSDPQGHRGPAGCIPGCPVNTI